MAVRNLVLSPSSAVLNPNDNDLNAYKNSHGIYVFKLHSDDRRE